MSDNTKLTAGQVAVLAVVDKHGASTLSTRTRENTNTVHAGSARSLVKAGELEEYAGPDGPMVRRPVVVATESAEPVEATNAIRPYPDGVADLIRDAIERRDRQPAKPDTRDGILLIVNPPPNVRITEFFGARIGLRVSAEAAACALDCSASDVRRMCDRLIRAGIMRKQGGGSFTMFTGPGTRTIIVK